MSAEKPIVKSMPTQAFVLSYVLEILEADTTSFISTRNQSKVIQRKKRLGVLIDAFEDNRAEGRPSHPIPTSFAPQINRIDLHSSTTWIIGNNPLSLSCNYVSIQQVFKMFSHSEKEVLLIFSIIAILTSDQRPSRRHRRKAEFLSLTAKIAAVLSAAKEGRPMKNIRVLTLVIQEPRNPNPLQGTSSSIVESATGL
ncbi:uncharacterized protein MELLADRAFT_64080 [Melampsora larici-populina 98AG31]|uniref:Uncharacterized protein n=1 Tax=Melampsora larici-populina (strain 98AG31 / pathotype 3-4-7) TaxID=747676 RepID=F4RQK2_MELLP|nr:uncharacterized protein MELLADRAFT_64080 [Melampsora larici-populina 98AG31]EGG05500.1 hypothetical protein MELLADRAFT_64080 [Melampsora larici-populina 98AG31]